MMVLFNQEYATERYGETMKEEGRAEGRAESARGMYEAGISLDLIATAMKTTVDVVKKMIGIGQDPIDHAVLKNCPG